MEKLDAFYSECLGYPLVKAKSGEVRIASSEHRLCQGEGYGIIFPLLLLHSNCHYILSVRPDLLESVSAIVRGASDAETLFKDDARIIIESWCRDIIPNEVMKKLRWSQSFTHYVDEEHFHPFNVHGCKRLTPEDCDLIKEMDKVSDFGCPIESIQDGTAFGVIIDGKIVSRSSTIPTPNATKKFGLVWLGVETLPEYRLRGYAKAVISGATETILSRGQTPVYDHATWNKASENTAKSLGYQFYGESLRWQYPHD